MYYNHYVDSCMLDLLVINNIHITIGVKMLRTLGLLRQRQNNIRERLFNISSQFRSDWCSEEEIEEILLRIEPEFKSIARRLAIKLLKLTVIINKAKKLANSIQ